jgi:hypothetical protein
LWHKCWCMVECTTTLSKFLQDINFWLHSYVLQFLLYLFMGISCCMNLNWEDLLLNVIHFIIFLQSTNTDTMEISKLNHSLCYMRTIINPITPNINSRSPKLFLLYHNSYSFTGVSSNWMKFLGFSLKG